MKRRSLIIGLAIFGLVSCSVPSTPSLPPPSSTPVVTKTSTPIPTRILPTATATIPPEARLHLECLTVASTIPTDFRGVGTLVLGKRDASAEWWDMTTGTMRPVPDDWRWDDWRISPDESRLMQSSVDQAGTVRMKSMTSSGKEQRTFVWERSWAFAGWVDDERILIGVEPEPDDFYYSSTEVLNLVTGHRQKLSFGPVFSLVPRMPYWSLIYDPTLTRVLYPDYSESKSRFSLSDSETGEVLATIPSPNMEYHPPEWSPDGTQVIVVGTGNFEEFRGFEFYSLSREGQVTQLTNLSAYGGFLLSQYRWSPDGRSIAFWFSFFEGGELAVLNLETKEVTNYCIPGLNHYGFEEAPLWSPDSRQLAVESYSESDPSYFYSVIVDLEQKKAVRVGEDDFAPMLWLKTVPPIWLKAP